MILVVTQSLIMKWHDDKEEHILLYTVLYIYRVYVYTPATINYQ